MIHYIHVDLPTVIFQKKIHERPQLIPTHDDQSFKLVPSGSHHGSGQQIHKAVLDDS